MIFPKMSLLALAVAQSAHAQSVDCTIKENHVNNPDCYCSFPMNRNKDECKEDKGTLDEVNPNIINGEPVPANTYPWFARSTIGSGWGGCGGSLVTSEYVLTAAHCVEGRINQLKNNGGYQIGALCAPYGPNSNNNCGQDVESFGITEIYMHPEYGTITGIDHDFALVHLDGQSTIAPVAMDEGDISPGYEDLPNKGNLWPIGFGTTESGSVTSQLMHVNVNYVKQATCNAAYSGDITPDMICAADTNQDSCQGDSGGPMYDSDNEALVGVVSWGIGCALAQYPGVYARVSDEFEWIKETICADHGAPRPSMCGGPTANPTISASPTPAPTPCTQSEFKLDLTFDNYPAETSWTLTNDCTEQEQEQGGGYSDAGGTISVVECVPSAEYTFTISDEYGDGICCAYGQGAFKVTYNGEIVLEGSEFEGSESETFGECSSPSSPVNPEPTAPAPVPSAPVPAPTAAENFVFISAFSPKQIERDNGKLKTKLKFAVKDHDNNKVGGATVEVKVSYVSDDGDEEYLASCVTRNNGKCNVKLLAYHPDDYSQITVTVTTIIDTENQFVYLPGENDEDDGCPIFSSDCPTIELETSG